MDFQLDPPSGFADSYFDIEFLSTFESSFKTVLSLHNDTSKEHLGIIGVANGHILEGNMAVVKQSNQIRGHFNIFNDDKMNTKFQLYNNVTIRCKVEHFNEEGESTGTEEKTLLFYNENHSLDADILPFDLIVHNGEMNFGNDASLKIDVISGLARKYGLCVQSVDGKNQCHIEISAKRGRTTIEIPAPLLYYDLNLKTQWKKKFHITYVKFQGTTFSRMANRKYFPIKNSELSFVVGNGLSPQSRIDPAGRLLSGEFILSDRYLVLCPKEYSGFSKKSEFSPEKLMDLTMLTNEGQHMDALSKEIKQFDASSSDGSAQKIKQTQQSIQRSKNKIRSKVSKNQIQLMRSISGAYEAISFNTKETNTPAQQSAAFPTSAPKPIKQGCAPCSRKRNKNA